MTHTPTAPEAWRKVAPRLTARLNADLRNHRMLRDPWSRPRTAWSKAGETSKARGDLAIAPQLVGAQRHGQKPRKR